MDMKVAYTLAWIRTSLVHSPSSDTIAARFSDERFPRGKMVGAFEAKAFGTPVGAVTEPFKSASGWHIVLVEGRKA